MRANEFIIESVNQLYRQGVFEGVPQPGKSSGKPISWIDPTKVVTKYLTLDEIFKSVSGIPYYNNVVTDRDNKDFTWGVTKRVIQYAKELVIRPDTYKNWPPIIVLDGKLQDGAHRISTIYLMQQRVQPNDPIWKNAKLKVEFGTSDNVKQGVAEGLQVDVPNEDWLQDKIDYAKSKGRNSFGVPYMGSTTAIVRGTPPRVKLERLASLPGMRNEQMKVRKDDLKWLMDYMERTGKLPPMGSSPDREYLPFIMVAYNGEAWVNEGNHRIMAAYRLNWPDMPVEIRYFDGGEQVASGPMAPGKIGLGPVKEQKGVVENFANSVKQTLNEVNSSAVHFRTASTDNYQNSFTVTAIADGKNVGHFSFFRDPESDDVHNQAEVTDDVRGKGYGKALLLKAIEVANDHGLGFQEDSQSLSHAQSRVYDSLYDAGWIVDADGYWFLTHEGEQELARLSTIQKGVAEGKSNTIPKIGINVRSDGDIDYASLIVDGKKKYESRKTDSLRPYVGKTVGIVRTGNGPAVAIGQATIGEPIVVNAEKFDLLRKKHLVPKDSKFDIDSDDTKYLYPMINPVRWENEKSIKHKGIVSRKIQESMAYINQSNKGGNLEGYVVDSNKPQLINYLSSQGADNNLINQLKQKYKTIAIIRNMYVDEDQRGQGYGNQLVSDAIDDAAGNHANAIICVADIGEDNAIDLVKWYENFGFEVVGKAGSDPVMVLEL